MSTIKISQLPAKGANLEATDLVEISEFDGSGYVSKSITGQEIIDGASGGGVTDVTATAPLSSSGGSTPDISMHAAGSADDGYLTSSDWNTFNDKQDLLISGTNIKTVNSTSLLGSGDVSVGVTNINTFSPLASTGGATPYLSISEASASGDGYLNATDWSTFNGKQDTLVSGTNIKTINGNTLLGSGDLTISGGGGISVPIPQVPTIGYMNSLYNTNSAAPTIVNNMYLFPFIPMNNINTSSLIIQVTTAQAGSTGKMVVYSSTSQGLPSTLLVESTALDCSTTGFKTFSSFQTYTANTKYWIGFVGSVSNINTTSNSMTPIIGVRTNANSVYNCLLFTITYPTIPATITTGSANFNNQASCPRLTFVF